MHWNSLECSKALFNLFLYSQPKTVYFSVGSFYILDFRRPSVQPTCTRKTGNHCLDIFIARKEFVFTPFLTVKFSVYHHFSSTLLFLSLILQRFEYSVCLILSFLSENYSRPTKLKQTLDFRQEHSSWTTLGNCSSKSSKKNSNKNWILQFTEDFINLSHPSYFTLLYLSWSAALLSSGQSPIFRQDVSPEMSVTTYRKIRRHKSEDFRRRILISFIMSFYAWIYLVTEFP
jgi:hypothetical protein